MLLMETFEIFREEKKVIVGNHRVAGLTAGICTYVQNIQQTSYGYVFHLILY